MPVEHAPKGTHEGRSWHTFPAWDRKSDQEEESMKSLDFLERVDHNRKAAIYAAAHDGKLRKFAHHEEFGDCRATFSRLLQHLQRAEIAVVLTPDATCP